MTNYEHAKNIIFNAMEQDTTKKNKNYWWAYITALVDFNVITQREYQNLRDYILCTKVVKKINGG